MIKAILVICNRKSRRENERKNRKEKEKKFMGKSPVLCSSFRNGTIAAGWRCLNGFIMAEDNRTHGGKEKRKQKKEWRPPLHGLVSPAAPRGKPSLLFFRHVIPGVSMASVNGEQCKVLEIKFHAFQICLFTFFFFF